MSSHIAYPLLRFPFTCSERCSMTIMPVSHVGDGRRLKTLTYLFSRMMAALDLNFFFFFMAMSNNTKYPKIRTLCKHKIIEHA